MKKETKDLLVLMFKSWNQFNPQKAVKADFDADEFNKGSWALDVSLSGMVYSDFVAFILPALQAHNCIWFLNAYHDNIIMHIQ